MSVPVDPRLLEILICPACHGEIFPLEEDRGLECRACGRVYPIRDGIPVMLVEEASPPKTHRGRAASSPCRPPAGPGAPALKKP